MRTVRSQRLPNFPWRLKPILGTCRKDRQSCLEALLHAQGIGFRQLVLFGERPVRPECSYVDVCKSIEFAEKSIAQGNRRFGPQRSFGGT